MELLTNGDVMATLDGDSAGADWGLLTPDSSGSYVNGTWTKLANANYTRLFDATQVLQNGNVFVAGGEYGTGAATGEIYNPLTNTWTSLPSQSYGSFIDANSILLPNGNVLILPVSPSPSGYTTIFNPSTNTWSQGPKLYRGGSADEESFVKLSDDSILLSDGNGTSERYIPSLNQWVNDGTVPVSLFDSLYEEGPGIRLSDGRAFFIGATGHSAIYTPSGSTAPGTWVAGPDLPTGQGTDDAPLAMLPNGTILCCAGPTGTYNGPTTFYTYDPVANTFTTISGPATIGGPPFLSRMLELPNGQVLYSSGGSQLYVYSPGVTPLAAAVPSITSIANNPDGSLTLTGTGLNGIDAGASYGDDAQMDTNRPIVSLSSGATVYYARTYNWSSTSVATGSLAETVNFTLPLGIPAGTYSVVASANGVGSSAVPLTISTTANNAAPTVAVPAAASASPVTTVSTTLSVLGADDAGESNLVYTWQTTAAPSGVSLPSFSLNGTNAAKNTVATFYKQGTYTFSVTITDAGGLSVSSAVTVVVNQTESQLTLTPALGSLAAGGTEQLTAQALDQFGVAMATQPAFTWSMLSGAGSISTSGKYTAPTTAGMLATIRVTDAKYQKTAQVGVTSPPWSNLDVGSPGVAGTGYDAGGTFTLEGSGSDIWGTADAFHFVYQTLSGDGMITAKVVAQQNTNASAKAGVMIRNSLNNNDQYVLMAATPTSGITLQDRTTSGASAVQTAVASGAAPYWVRLVKIGGTISGYRSTDGVNWTLQGTVSVTMGTTVYVGLAVCAHNNAVLNTSTFNNVSLVALPSNYGFETPALGTGAPGDYAVAPGGASWTFQNSAGIAANGSSITSANPNAPEGTQVGFLEQAGASFTQSVTLTAGTRAITFAAAQRAGNAAPQDFQVLLDGAVVCHFTPGGTAYATYATNPFTVTAGTHTIQFLALDSAGGDNTALIDNVNLKTAPAVGLSLSSGTTPSNATQSLTFTATVTDGVADGETISLLDASNGNKVVATGTTSGGSATLTVPAGTLLAGTHNLVAYYAGDANFAPAQSASLAQTVQVVVTSAVVDGNLPALAGAQRSMVDSIVYTFSEPVTLATANAFMIAVHAGLTGTVPTLNWAAINADASGASTQWVVTFGGPNVVGNSIANGVYDITLSASAVSPESNPSGPVASRPTDTFYRLFGDSDGDGYVTNLDYARFRTALAGAYNPVFDSDADGYITNLDYARFRNSLALGSLGTYTTTI